LNQWSPQFAAHFARNLQRKIALHQLARRQAAIDSIDWLGLWALSLGFCAIVLAGIACFRIGDNIGASGTLLGAGAIIAVIIRFGAAGDEAGKN
jgi:hypothetical protein